MSRRHDDDDIDPGFFQNSRGSIPTDKADIWTRLAAPVDVDREKPATAELAMYFAQRRLDAVAPGEWDTTFEVLPSRFTHNVTGETSVKCRVQILGVIREACGTGPTYVDSFRNAFLGACCMFGIPCEPTGANDAKSFDVPPVPFNE